MNISEKTTIEEECKKECEIFARKHQLNTFFFPKTKTSHAVFGLFTKIKGEQYSVVVPFAGLHFSELPKAKEIIAHRCEVAIKVLENGLQKEGLFLPAS